jgi:hypothetical protein
MDVYNRLGGKPVCRDTVQPARRISVDEFKMVGPDLFGKGGNLRGTHEFLHTESAKAPE